MQRFILNKYLKLMLRLVECCIFLFYFIYLLKIPLILLLNVLRNRKIYYVLSVFFNLEHSLSLYIYIYENILERFSWTKITKNLQKYENRLKIHKQKLGHSKVLRNTRVTFEHSIVLWVFKHPMCDIGRSMLRIVLLALSFIYSLQNLT